MTRLCRFPRLSALLLGGMVMAVGPGVATAQSAGDLQHREKLQYQITCENEILREREPISLQIVGSAETRTLLTGEGGAPEEWSIYQVAPFVGGGCADQRVSFKNQSFNYGLLTGKMLVARQDVEVAPEERWTFMVAHPGGAIDKLTVTGDLLSDRGTKKDLHEGNFDTLAIQAGRYGVNVRQFRRLYAQGEESLEAMQWMKLPDGSIVRALCYGTCPALNPPPMIRLIGVAVDGTLPENFPTNVRLAALDAYAVDDCALLAERPEDGQQINLQLSDGVGKRGISAASAQVPAPDVDASSDAVCLRASRAGAWSDNTLVFRHAQTDFVFFWTDPKDEGAPKMPATPLPVIENVRELTVSFTADDAAARLLGAQGDLIVVLRARTNRELARGALAFNGAEASVTIDRSALAAAQGVTCGFSGAATEQEFMRYNCMDGPRSETEDKVEAEKITAQRFAVAFPMDALSGTPLEAGGAKLQTVLPQGTVALFGNARDEEGSLSMLTNAVIAPIDDTVDLKDLQCTARFGSAFDLDSNRCELVEAYKLGSLLEQPDQRPETRLQRRRLSLAIPVDLSQVPHSLSSADLIDEITVRLYDSPAGRKLDEVKAQLDDKGTMIIAKVLAPLVTRGEALEIELIPSETVAKFLDSPVKQLFDKPDYFSGTTDGIDELKAGSVNLELPGKLFSVEEIRVSARSKDNGQVQLPKTCRLELRVTPTGAAFDLFPTSEDVERARAQDGLSYFQPLNASLTNDALFVPNGGRAEVVASRKTPECIVSGDTHLRSDGTAEVSVDSTQPIMVFVTSGRAGEAMERALADVGAVSGKDRAYFWSRMLSIPTNAMEVAREKRTGRFDFVMPRGSSFLHFTPNSYITLAKATGTSELFPSDQDIGEALPQLEGESAQHARLSPDNLVALLDVIRKDNTKASADGGTVTPVIGVNIRAEILQGGLCDEFAFADEQLRKTGGDRLLVIGVSADPTEATCRDDDLQRIRFIEIGPEGDRQSYSSSLTRFRSVLFETLDDLEKDIEAFIR